MAPTSTFHTDFTAQLREKYGNSLTIPEAIEAVGYSRRSLGRDIDAGRITVYRVGRGRVLRLRAEDVAALVTPAN